jgi:hypothetical protein
MLLTRCGMGSPPDVGILREKSWKVALLGSHLFWFELSLPVVWQGLGFRLAFLPQMGFTRGRSVSAVGLSRRNRWREPPLRLEKLCPTYRHTSLTRCRIIAVLKLSSLGRLGPTGRLGFRRSDLVRVWLTSTGRALCGQVADTCSVYARRVCVAQVGGSVVTSERYTRGPKAYAAPHFVWVQIRV